MAFVPGSAENRPPIGIAIVWAALNAVMAVAVAVPFVVIALRSLVLVLGQGMWASVGLAAWGLLGSVLGGLYLSYAIAGILRSLPPILHPSAHGDRHWWYVRRALQRRLSLETTLFAVGAWATAAAVLGRNGGVIGIAAGVDAIFVLVQLSVIDQLVDELRHASVIPYFPRSVGEIQTFGQGESLARQVAGLDEIAESLGLTPLSAFGWNDDFECEPLVWHGSAEGLKTVNALILFFQRDEVAWDDRDEVVADLKRLAHALTRSEAQDIPFSLLLRHLTGTNGLEWETRKGTCF